MDINLPLIGTTGDQNIANKFINLNLNLDRMNLKSLNFLLTCFLGRGNNK